MSPAGWNIPRWLSPAVFGLWGMVLLYLVMTGRYTVSLRPEFGMLLGLAHFVALGCMLALLCVPTTARRGPAGVLRLLIVLLPLVSIMGLQQNMQLSGQSFKKRFLGLGDPSWTADGDGSDGGRGGRRAAISQDLAPSDGVTERTVMEILRNAAGFQGQRVAVLGMLVQDEQILQQYGADIAVLYRFLISCCAADARPVAIAVRTPVGYSPQAEQWVRVEGTFVIAELRGNRVPLLDEAVISPTEQPAFPYLF